MDRDPQIFFGPFHLDTISERLWKGPEEIPVRPKPLAVLRYLVTNAGRMVSREELKKAIWSDTYVSYGALSVYIKQIREAFGDDAKNPQFIETTPRRGYRFIGPGPVSRVVGRDPELEQLQGLLENAVLGVRQVVFVTGEVGIGKTTAVERFMRKAADERVLLASGQCLEHYGVGEPYLPVLQALGQVCRESDGERLVEILRRHAPTWLVQMPALVSDAELEGLQRKIQGTTQERMLREMAEAMEVMTDKRPLVLVLEDLQWSDHSTLDLIAYLARRRERARLLVMGTYRPEDAVGTHPLRGIKQELQTHSQCKEVRLRLLTEAEMSQYIAARFPGSALPAELAQLIHHHTDGNPLFMVNIVDDLIAQGVLVRRNGVWELTAALETLEVSVPENVQQMIEKRIDRLSPEHQQVLEVASVAGMEFSAAALAAGLEQESIQVEVQCEESVRRGQFLHSRGRSVWPDGTVSTRYVFVHALYQNVFYNRIPAGKQVQLHQRIGEWEEAAYGTQVGEIAVELAMHFEQGQDYVRAVQYLGQAGENATRLNAHQEAIRHFTKGLELLNSFPETLERIQQELALQVVLSVQLMATKGYTAPEVEKGLSRARELCQQVGETPYLFPVLFGLFAFYQTRTEYQTALELGKEIERRARRSQDPGLFMEAHFTLGFALLYTGHLIEAQEHWSQGIALYDPQKHRPMAFLFGGADPGAVYAQSTWAFWIRGYQEQALKVAYEAIAGAQDQPFSTVFGLHFVALAHQFRREDQAALEAAEEEVAVSSEYGFPFWRDMGMITRGGALARLGRGGEGIASMRQGLAANQTIGADIGNTYWLALLAEGYVSVGKIEEGLSVLDESFATMLRNGERWWEAELYRLKGEFLLSLSRKNRAKAETCFHQAIDIARQQSAKSLELRAVMSLARLWQRKGKKDEVRQMLAEVYNWFTEGFDTPDLKEAKALLVALR